MEGMKKNMKTSVFFMGILIFLASCNPARGQADCVTGILPALLPCQGFLGNLLPVLPSKECCAAAKNVAGMGTTASLCQCLKQNLIPSGILPFNLNLIPNLCSLTDLAPLVTCILEPSTPSSKQGSH